MRYFNELTHLEKRIVASSLRSADYYLLAGAGISLDSSGSDELMPSGGKLQSTLSNLTGVPEFTQLHLSYKLLSEDDIEREITNKFTCTKIGRTALELANIAWKKIFTLNVDDCMERAWSHGNVSNKQTLTIKNYVDEFYEADDKQEAIIIHLHGFVRRAADGYVFSYTEYARNQSSQSAWMNTLSDLIRSEPFIVAGTQLNEIDLEYYMSFRQEGLSRPDTAPSILIEPYPTRLTELKCEEVDMVLYKGNTLEFLKEMSEIAPITADLAGILPKEADDFFPAIIDSKEKLQFFNGFELVPESPEGNDNAAKFLLGDHPNWRTLDRGVDVPRDYTNGLIEFLEESLIHRTAEEAQLVLVTAEAGAGNSTIARRCAFLTCH